MRSYESKFFGLRMQIPDGWEVRTWPDDGMEELARIEKSYKSARSATSFGQALRPLMFADLYAPGSHAVIDACIEFQAWAESDDYFLKGDEAKPLKKWNVNGIEILYHDDFRDSSPENMYYRFPRWKVAPGLWLYARMLASGRTRFDYVLSVFETLAPLNCTPREKKNALFERGPWNVAPSFFRLAKMLNDDGPLYDLVLDSPVSEEVLSTNRAILSGRAGPSRKKWTPMDMRRRSRVRRQDCYYGPQALYSSGIFSSRTIELLRPYMGTCFIVLPCTVNRKPHYFLCLNKGVSCLDVENSEIKRFHDGSIMEIKRYRFKKELVPDPLLFAIPEEHNAVFTTASIPSIVAKAGLTGIAFYPVDGNGREYTYPG